MIFLMPKEAIGMLAQYLDEQTFLRGVAQYIKKYEYRNTTTDDLWASLSEESGRDVVGLIQTLTKDIGFPMITVTESDHNVHIRQNRFLKSADAAPDEDQNDLLGSIEAKVPAR